MPRTQSQLRADPSSPSTTSAKINHSSRFRHPDLQPKLEQRGRAGARCRRGNPSSLSCTVRAGTGAPRLWRLLPSPARGRRSSHGARNKRGTSAERPGLRGAAALPRHEPMGVFFPTSLVMRVLVGSFPALSSRNPSLTKSTPPFPRRGPEQRCHGACPASLPALGSRREQGRHCPGLKAG